MLFHKHELNVNGIEIPTALYSFPIELGLMSLLLLIRGIDLVGCCGSCLVEMFCFCLLLDMVALGASTSSPHLQYLALAKGCGH